MIRIGVLSDTHLGGLNEEFVRQVEHCFKETEMILHAGDLTDISVLEAFAGKEVRAVSGNMCEVSSYSALPESRVVEVGGFTIALNHGVRYSPGIEERLLVEFGGADCIVYGHTHRPVCHRLGQVLIVNPGTFRSTGRYGAPGTYAIIEVGRELVATIHEVGAGV